MVSDSGEVKWTGGRRGPKGDGGGGMGSSSGPKHAISTGLHNFEKYKILFVIHRLKHLQL